MFKNCQGLCSHHPPEKSSKKPKSRSHLPHFCFIHPLPRPRPEKCPTSGPPTGLHNAASGPSLQPEPPDPPPLPFHALKPIIQRSQSQRIITSHKRRLSGEVNALKRKSLCFADCCSAGCGNGWGVKAVFVCFFFFKQGEQQRWERLARSQRKGAKVPAFETLPSPSPRELLKVCCCC